MSNNILEKLAGFKTKDPKRSNFDLDFDVTTSTSFGYVRPIYVEELIAGTRKTLDVRGAISSNPTISPVLSRAKHQVVAIWIPSRLYVPALRDNAQVKPGKTDYSFPTVNFHYPNLTTAANADTESRNYGLGLPYVPANSIYTELEMWSPYFTPSCFILRDGASQYYPEPKNAIPLLGYYDFIRSYVFNTQEDSAPLRVHGYSGGEFAQLFNDHLVTREDFDNLFKAVREIGSDYPTGDYDGFQGSFDITTPLAVFMGASDWYDSSIVPIPFPSRRITNIRDVMSGKVAPDLFNDHHFGEFRQTYMGDFFASFLSNEQVEYERSTARVQTDDDGYIRIESIYHAERIQNFIRKSVFRNSGFDDFVDAQLGVRPKTTIDKPMILGAFSSWISWNDIVATSQTGDVDSTLEDNKTLGSRAGLGFGKFATGKYTKDDKGRPNKSFVDFTPLEPGYLMLLHWIKPEVNYFRGFNPLYDKRSLESLYYPVFDKDGYQDKQFKYVSEYPVMTDINGVENPGLVPGAGIDFRDYNVAYAQEPAYYEHMTSYNRLKGQMVESGLYRHWSFARNGQLVDLDINQSQVRKFTTSYILPEAYNYIFANIQNIDNFQCYFSFDSKSYQPMSHRFLSFN